MEIKPCNKCLHYQEIFEIPTCQRPLKNEKELDYVDGSINTHTVKLNTSCRGERSAHWMAAILLRECGTRARYFTPKPSPITIYVPPQPKWYVTFGNPNDIRLYLINPPNKFHRIMQRLILGLHWGKDK